MLRVLLAVVAVAFVSSPTRAQAAPTTAPTTALTTAPTSSPPQPVDEAVEGDWGLAGDALTVGAAGIGAAVGIVAMVATASPDGSIPLPALALPVVLPAGFASGVRALQPRRTPANLVLPAVGACVGTVLGAAGYIVLMNTPGSFASTISKDNAPGGVAIALSTIALGTMATTTAAVAVAHLIDNAHGASRSSLGTATSEAHE